MSQYPQEKAQPTQNVTQTQYPQQDRPLPSENVAGTFEKANGILNQHLKPDLQKMNFGVQPVPTHRHGNSWTNDFFGCFAPPELCFMGWCCPCFLFGRTQARMKGVRDPDLFNVNTDCAVWLGLYALGGWQCIYQTMKRIDTRDRLNIQGTPVTDCLASWCCACCALVQEEKETLLKQEAIDAKLQQYSAPQGMSYQ